MSLNYYFRKSKLLFLFFALSAFQLAAQSSFYVVGYVPNWINVTTFANNFDYSKVTHINFAFQNPNAAGNLVESSTGLTTLVTKAHAAGVKVLVSLGGGGASEDATIRGYYFNLITSANRAAFVSKISDYVDQYSLDGVDIDMEGPAINSNYDGFITELASSMHGNNRGKLLTAALKHDYGGNNVLNATLPKFDFINIMAYDATGSWDATPGQHSSMSYAQTSLNYWVNKGMPKNKITLGLPFYGYGWNADAGNQAYSTILAQYPTAWNSDVIGNIIYYNGVQTIEDKTQYAKDNGYAGVMIWELSNDATGQYSLLKAISDVLGTGAVQSAYGSTISIPGKVEVENYDNGGQNIAFNDVTPTNEGAAGSRADAVDLENCTDAGGGLNVGYTVAGEWLEYSVNVTTSGSYRFEARVAATAAGKTFHIEMNGTNVTGAITVPNTGGWQTWQTVTVNNISLTSGNKIMRIVFDAGDFNLNYVNVADISTGISMLENKALSVFPNPASGTLNIQSDIHFAQMEIYNLQGEKMIESNQTKIDVQPLSSGIYMLKMTAVSGEAMYSKFVKE